ncbi:shikimate dehydrogenase [Epilithonimonas ginsengisoli]|uniref:Shikimate dehydrogenase n=1 Tax=Epilithonimonas ginsengisoli TaxID=1245592 RepID=A0ABU4JIX4_9FLAO|nr:MULTISPECIES: shikimate dehydrogenase [Chryseobacterium group]MBV6878862.1 shikimate dehydrogenase [Epilithonimonas sp. FP105]MDW8549466.1 shikimate dehydrogenase [Epilithonimonas ginsengisoli]OAH71657.1 shikimate dehydrogenase [Chryseobacterium sp. FP211-J200]
MENQEFGLLGKNISYSFSKKYFEEKFKKLFLKHHSYNFFDIPEIESLNSITENPNLVGMNVTIPYKQAIIPFLDELSDEASKIGAVNCVSFQNGKKIGYNTDAFGFEKTLLINKKEYHNKALIIGDGGAAKAVRYILDKHNIQHKTVSRKSEINFENLSEDLVKDSLLIIQTTPVGTFPNVDDSVPFPFDAITDKHYVIDLIYNPSETTFLRKSAEKGATTLNGFYMLEQQAEKAWEIWKS